MTRGVAPDVRCANLDAVFREILNVWLAPKIIFIARVAVMRAGAL
jgi:hypothetical protein